MAWTAQGSFIFKIYLPEDSFGERNDGYVDKNPDVFAEGFLILNLGNLSQYFPHTLENLRHALISHVVCLLHNLS